jgi:hypothetical protein
MSSSESSTPNHTPQPRMVVQNLYIPDAAADEIDLANQPWMMATVIDDDDLMFGGKPLCAWYEEDRRLLSSAMDEEEPRGRPRERSRGDSHHHHQQSHQQPQHQHQLQHHHRRHHSKKSTESKWSAPSFNPHHHVTWPHNRTRLTFWSIATTNINEDWMADVSRHHRQWDTLQRKALVAPSFWPGWDRAVSGVPPISRNHVATGYTASTHLLSVFFWAFRRLSDTLHFILIQPNPSFRHHHHHTHPLFGGHLISFFSCICRFWEGKHHLHCRAATPFSYRAAFGFYPCRLLHDTTLTLHVRLDVTGFLSCWAYIPGITSTMERLGAGFVGLVNPPRVGLCF